MFRVNWTVREMSGNEEWAEELGWKEATLEDMMTRCEIEKRRYTKILTRKTVDCIGQSINNWMP
jgi:hypothetical protein